MARGAGLSLRLNVLQNTKCFKAVVRLRLREGGGEREETDYRNLGTSIFTYFVPAPSSPPSPAPRLQMNTASPVYLLGHRKNASLLYDPSQTAGTVAAVSDLPTTAEEPPKQSGFFEANNSRRMAFYVSLCIKNIMTSLIFYSLPQDYILTHHYQRPFAALH